MDLRANGAALGGGEAPGADDHGVPMAAVEPTFLFTDIEGSTRLWEEQPVEMREALARHDLLVRESIEASGGRVFKTVGDAFCAVFDEPESAVRAAVAVQEGAEHLEVEAASLRLRIRIAIHSGPAEFRDEDYFGPTLNRLSRLLAAGHGGQVLLSGASRHRISAGRCSGSAFRDLGRHRLRDLQQPEQVFQLLHPDLRADFPPLRSLSCHPNNLPQQLTSFVGRERDITAVKQLLAAGRLLTLTGTGGTGKTRLSLQVAADLVGEFREGVWLVELALLRDAGLVPQAVAAALELREQPGKALEVSLVDALRDRELLLVLDNCEHLIQAVARVCELLLQSCPGVRVLASSREPLRIPGERTYPVPSLSLPDTRRPLPVEELESYEAVRLFVDRAALHGAGFRLSAANAAAVVQVCRRLDGIPLAIELAAARVRSLKVERLAERLDDRFRLLTGGSRTALPHQRTLRALIDWSHELLEPGERVLFRRLAVFSGGWTLEAAEMVCADAADAAASGQVLTQPEILDLLASLVDKSLVLFEEDGERYRLLETVRRYAGDRLGEAGEEPGVRGRHRDYFLRLAEEAEARLTGPEQADWLARLEQEHDNLRAALGWCRVDPGSVEAGLRLAGALWRFWYVRGHYREGRQWLGLLLEHPAGGGNTRARALTAAGNLACVQGDYSVASGLLREGLALFRETGDQDGVAFATNCLGAVAQELGRPEEAGTLYQECLELWRQSGDRKGVADALSNLGRVAELLDQPDRARLLYEESLSLRRNLRDRRGIAISLNNLGQLAFQRGEYAEAAPAYEEVLAISSELGDPWFRAVALHNRAEVAFEQSETDRATALFAESTTAFRELGDRACLAHSLAGLSRAVLSRGDTPGARRLAAESLRLRVDLGDPAAIRASLEILASVLRVQGQEARAAQILEAVPLLESGTARTAPEDHPEPPVSTSPIVAAAIALALEEPPPAGSDS